MKKSYFALMLALGMIGLNFTAQADFVQGRVRTFMKCVPQSPSIRARILNLLEQDGSSRLMVQTYVPTYTAEPVILERYILGRTQQGDETIYTDANSGGGFFTLRVRPADANGKQAALLVMLINSKVYSQLMSCTSFALTM